MNLHSAVASVLHYDTLGAAFCRSCLKWVKACLHRIATGCLGGGLLQKCSSAFHWPGPAYCIGFLIASLSNPLFKSPLGTPVFHLWACSHLFSKRWRISLRIMTAQILTFEPDLELLFFWTELQIRLKMKTGAALHVLELPNLSYVFEALNSSFQSQWNKTVQLCGSAALACIWSKHQISGLIIAALIIAELHDLILIYGLLLFSEQSEILISCVLTLLPQELLRTERAYLLHFKWTA